MNPLKCTFGVTFGKFLGFIVHYRGIEINQSKFRAIPDMLELKNPKVAWHTFEDSYQILLDDAIPSATL